jgi:concentrative nucleoside transporter, CNT family
MRRPSKTILGLWIAAAVLLTTGATVAGTSEPVPAAGASFSASNGAVPTAQQRVSSIGQTLDTPFWARARSLVGLAFLGFVAWVLSVDRKRISWRIVFWGVGLQLLFAVFILKTPAGVVIFDGLNRAVMALLGFTVSGAQFIFGNLVWDNIPVGTGPAGAAGQGVFTPSTDSVANAGALFAFNVLPTIIFFSSLMTVLYHLGVMQLVVKGFAWIMQRTMRTSGAETLSAAGNIFVGQTEAPLLIKPFIERMTMSELMAVMTGGFATVAGGVLAAYVGMLVAFFPDIAGHLMAASVMSAPAALVIAKLMYPETEESETSGTLELAVERPDVNVIDAAARGAGEGLHLALNVGAMLLAFVALVYMFDGILGLLGGFVGFPSLSLQMILGWLLAPVAWLMGVTWADASQVGALLGLKTALNEFFAYLQLASILGSDSGLEPRSVIITTYALSGFANFSSIAIQIGGIGGIAPSRRQDLSRIGLQAMIGGTLAAFMTATVAGMLL